MSVREIAWMLPKQTFTFPLQELKVSYTLTVEDSLIRVSFKGKDTHQDSISKEIRATTLIISRSFNPFTFLRDTVMIFVYLEKCVKDLLYFIAPFSTCNYYVLFYPLSYLPVTHEWTPLCTIIKEKSVIWNYTTFKWIHRKIKTRVFCQCSHTLYSLRTEEFCEVHVLPCKYCPWSATCLE